MLTLVTGSIAFDKIMMFNGKFGDHILPTKTHSLNVAFHIPNIRNEHGGTGANIAYALASLGDKPLLIGAVGSLDSAHYVDLLEKRGVEVSMLKHVKHAYSAQANIMTDMMNNQITAFHPGAMGYASEIEVESIIRTVSAQGKTLSNISIVSPDDKYAMLNHVSGLNKLGIDLIFDPGQALPLFSKHELMDVLDKSYLVTLNDYEAELLVQITGLAIEGDNSILSKLSSRNGGLIVTRGKDGVDFYRHNESVLHVGIAKVDKVVDPTGCGDAFRAGLLYVLAKERNFELALKAGVCTGGIQVQYPGAQNHNISYEQLLEIGKHTFGIDFCEQLNNISGVSQYTESFCI